MQAIQKAILQLLADGQWHSIEEIAEQLSISRAAIDELFQIQLSKLAFNIEYINQKGYRILDGIDFLNKAMILDPVSKTNLPFCPDITLLDEIDSTNTYLLRYAKTQAPKPQLCLAESQMQGHGRRGRAWHTGFARNIALSCLWAFPKGTDQVAGLSLVIGVAVVKAMQRLGIETVQLKWPNDVMWQYRKLAGIATELHITPSGVCHTVIGIGLNVQLTQAEKTDKRVCLSDIMPIPCSRNYVAGLIIDELISHLREFETMGLSRFKNEWQQYHFLQDKQVDVQTLQGITTGIIHGIDDQGSLLLETAQGIETFHMGEVSVRARDWQ